MVDSPAATRHRLLARTDSIRFVAARGPFGFFAHGFTLASVLFMLFIILYPSSYQFSPWLRNAFHSSRRCHFSKVFGHYFSNDSKVSPPPSYAPLSHIITQQQENQSVTSSPQISRKEGSGLRIDNGVPPVEAPNQEPLPSVEKGSSNGVVPPVVEAPKDGPLTLATSEKDSSNEVAPVETSKQEPLPFAEKGSPNGVEDGNYNCDMFEGSWVRDDSYPLYRSGSCPFIDEPFNCFVNGRTENFYEKFRWQPKNCNMPRYFLMRVNLQFGLRDCRVRKFRRKCKCLKATTTSIFLV